MIDSDSIIDDITLKEMFIAGIKESSTGAWNPSLNFSKDESLYTAEYNYYFYNTTDNKDLLEQNLADENTRTLLKENGWLDNNKVVDIEYKINRYGFRCDNFSNDPGIIFLGCSNTYGTGLPLSAVWPSIVAEYFNLKSWNLGTPALSSTAGTFYLLNWYKDIPNPKAIVLLDPPLGRIEMYKKSDHYLQINLLRGMLERSKTALTVKLYDYIIPTSSISYKLNALALQLLAEKLNIPFVCGSLKTINNLSKQNDFARDLMHSGKKIHREIAEHFIVELKKAGLV